MKIDYDDLAATMATKFQNGNLDMCMTALSVLSPTQAALVAVRVMGIFYTSECGEPDKPLVRGWDQFLQRIAPGG